MKNILRASVLALVMTSVQAADLEIGVEYGGQNEVAIVPLTQTSEPFEYEFSGFQIGKGAKIKIWPQKAGALELQPTFRHMKYKMGVNDKGKDILVPENVVEWSGPVQRITPQRTFVLQQTGPASIRVRWSD